MHVSHICVQGRGLHVHDDLQFLRLVKICQFQIKADITRSRAFRTYATFPIRRRHFLVATGRESVGHLIKKRGVI
jgi:hypothetical protein